MSPDCPVVHAIVSSEEASEAELEALATSSKMASNGTAVTMLPMKGSPQADDVSAATTPVKGGSAPAKSEEELIGTWLCSEGPYQRYIAALSNSNPGLTKADPNNKDGPLKNGHALMVLLDAPATGQPAFAKTEFKNAADLERHFKASTHNHDRYRIYIMEGLAPDYVAHVGGHFFMEPAFFQRQERTCVWSNDFTPVSDALPYPSLLDPDKSFHLQYCELRQFNRAIENRYFFCERTRRHVGMTAPRSVEKSTVGILRRKISWWSRQTSQGGWDVVILCDPQLLYLSPEPKEFDSATGQLSNISNIRDALKNVPFQEGYVDFIPPPSHDEIKTKEKHPQSCMRRDLIHYYQQHADLLTEQDWKTPTMSAIFLKKIVAAQYLHLADYIKVMLPSLELRLTTAWVEEQDQWKSLQTISRRCGNYRDDIEDTLLSLGLPFDDKANHGSQSHSRTWKDCEKDFHYVYFRLKILKERADNLMSAMTGLASIAGNRQSLEEAKRVKRLNLLALLFIPLAYTSSLFSMQDGFAPNQDKFWVYWVSAIGVMAFTACVTWLLDTALDDEANWTWRPLWYLKFWGKQRKYLGNVRRHETGFYKKS